MGAKRHGQIRVMEVASEGREEGNVVPVSEQGRSQQEGDARWQGQEPQAEELQLCTIEAVTGKKRNLL